MDIETELANELHANVNKNQADYEESISDEEHALEPEAEFAPPAKLTPKKSVKRSTKKAKAPREKKTKALKKLTKNLEDDRTGAVIVNLTKMFDKYPTIDKVKVSLPHTEMETIDISGFANIQHILAYLFANIDRLPFTEDAPNDSAFAMLWIILDVLQNNTLNTLDKTVLYTDVADEIQFGSYKFVVNGTTYDFDVNGASLATLKVKSGKNST